MERVTDLVTMAIRGLRGIFARVRAVPVRPAPPSPLPPSQSASARDGADRCLDRAPPSVVDAAASHSGATVASIEAALRDSKWLYRHVFDHMPISMWHFDLTELADILKNEGADDPASFTARADRDPDFLLRLMDALIAEDVNDYTVRLFRARDRSNLLGRCGHLWRANPDAFGRVIASRVRGEPEYQVETRFTAFDGSPIDVLLSMTRVVTAGVPRCIVWLVDITSRKQAQEALERLQADTQTTLDSIPALAWRSRPDGFVEYTNAPWQAYTGFSLDQALGWGWAAAIHPDDRDDLIEVWTAVMASGQRGKAELRLRRFDGTYRWFMAQTEPVRDETGAVVAWYGTSSDIEDRKQAETALRRNEAYSAEAQRLSRTGAFAWQIPDGDTFWSDETYQIMGFDRNCTPSSDLAMTRVHPDDWEVARRERARMERAEQSSNFELRLLMPDGQTKHVQFLARLVTYESGKKEIVGALQDVTQARHSQQALYAAQNALAHAGRVATLGEISATIAHEVNQPLAAIVTNGETSLRWLDRPDPNLGKVRDLTRFLVDDARRASGIIDRIRRMATRGAPSRTAVSLNDIIHDSMIFLRHEFQSRRIAVSLELAPGLPPILGDRIQLQQVIVNLAINAAQAMEQSPGARTLIVRTLVAAPQTVSCSIEDSGPGIDAAHLPRLFDTLFTTKDNGIGMGLAISRSIVEAHHGTVHADNRSALGGARFSFTVPAASPAAAQPAAEVSPE